MPHLDASALDRDIDGVALLAAALGIPGFQPVRVGASKSRQHAQVLVVETDRLLRESISTQLHARGCMVFEAETGEQALAAIRDGKALDVLLTETTMPAGPDGWVLADTLAFSTRPCRSSTPAPSPGDLAARHRAASSLRSPTGVSATSKPCGSLPCAPVGAGPVPDRLR